MTSFSYIIITFSIYYLKFLILLSNALLTSFSLSTFLSTAIHFLILLFSLNFSHSIFSPHLFIITSLFLSIFSLLCYYIFSLSFLTFELYYSLYDPLSHSIFSLYFCTLFYFLFHSTFSFHFHHSSFTLNFLIFTSSLHLFFWFHLWTFSHYFLFSLSLFSFQFQTQVSLSRFSPICLHFLSLLSFCFLSLLYYYAFLFSFIYSEANQSLNVTIHFVWVFVAKWMNATPFHFSSFIFSCHSIHAYQTWRKIVHESQSSTWNMTLVE